MEILALIILILFSIVGFAAIFFTTFGTLIIFIGALLYAMITGFSIIGFKTLLLLFVLYLTGEALEYFLVIFGAKKLGGSNAAVAGALIGAIVGAILGVSFFGIGLIAGTFFGIFLGAFTAELLLRKDLRKSLKAGAGGVIGRVGSVAAKLVIGVLMIAIMIFKVID